MAHTRVYRLSCISKATIVFAALPLAGKQFQNFLTLYVTPPHSLCFGFFAPNYQTVDLGQ